MGFCEKLGYLVRDDRIPQDRIGYDRIQVTNFDFLFYGRHISSFDFKLFKWLQWSEHVIPDTNNFYS